MENTTLHAIIFGAIGGIIGSIIGMTLFFIGSKLFKLLDKWRYGNKQ